MFVLIKKLCLILTMLTLVACSHTEQSVIHGSATVQLTSVEPEVPTESHESTASVELIDISLDSEILEAYMDNGDIIKMRVKGPRPGYQTPQSSNFIISGKDADYGSGTWWCKSGSKSLELRNDADKEQAKNQGYNKCPMPYAMRFHAGYFIHEGNMESSGSAGCIRLDSDNAIWLFNRTRIGTRVSVGT